MPYLHKKKKKEINIAILGDTHCGKTSLIRRLVEDEYLEMDYWKFSEYNDSDRDRMHNVEFFYSQPPAAKHEQINRKKKSVHFSIIERSLSTCTDFNKPDNDRLRADLCVLCYPVCSPHACHNLVLLWQRYLEVNYPDTPVIVVATKIDLKQDTALCESLSVADQCPVQTHQGESVRDMMKAVSFKECSALTSQGVFDIFEEIRIQFKAIQHKNKRNTPLTAPLSHISNFSLLSAKKSLRKSNNNFSNHRKICKLKKLTNII